MRRIYFTFFAIVILAGMLASMAVRAEDKQELTPSELAGLCGGFTLPNGMDVNVGIDNQVSVNGRAIADAQFSLNGTTVKTSSSGITQLQGANGSTNVVQLQALGTTLITNTANNLTLAQVRTINIDVTNMSQMNLQHLNSFALVQTQMLNNLRNSIH